MIAVIRRFKGEGCEDPELCKRHQFFESHNFLIRCDNTWYRIERVDEEDLKGWWRPRWERMGRTVQDNLNALAYDIDVNR